MTITIAQHTGTDAMGGTAQNPTITYASAQTAGNLNAVIIFWGDTTNSISSVSDSQGNTYSLLGNHQVSGATWSVWYCASIAAHAAGNVVTFHGSGSLASPEAWILEGHTTTGSWSAGPFDFGHGTTGTAMTTGTDNLTGTPALGFAAFVCGSGAWSSAGSGWTALDINSGADASEWQAFTTNGNATATANQNASSSWECVVGYFYTAASNAGLEDEGSSFSPWIHDRRLPLPILASGAEDVAVTPLKIDESGPNPPPMFDMGRELLSLGLFQEDVAVTPIKIDDVGVPLSPLFDAQPFLLATAEEPAVVPLTIDDVGVPLPPLFDAQPFLLATAEEPAVVPLQIDDVGVPLPPLFVDGLAIMATAEEPSVTPLKIDDVGVPFPILFDPGLPMMAAAEEAVTATPVLDDAGSYWQPIVIDWISIRAQPEESAVVPLTIDETSFAPQLWLADTLVRPAPSDEVPITTVVVASLEETSATVAIVSDVILSQSQAIDDLPSIALDESSPSPNYLASDTYAPQLFTEDASPAPAYEDGAPVLSVFTDAPIPTSPTSEEIVSIISPDEMPTMPWAHAVEVRPLRSFDDDFSVSSFVALEETPPTWTIQANDPVWRTWAPYLDDNLPYPFLIYAILTHRVWEPVSQHLTIEPTAITLVPAGVLIHRAP